MRDCKKIVRFVVIDVFSLLVLGKGTAAIVVDKCPVLADT